MVSGNALSFPSQNIDIPSITTANSPLLQFAPNFVGQNSFMPPMQNVQNSGNLINDDVSPFDDSDDLIEGPLDIIVDQIIDRQISEQISDSPLSTTFDNDKPVITYSNKQPNNPSPQNVPTRSVLSPNPPSRNVTSPNVPSPSMAMRSSPSPNAPGHQVPSPGTTTQNILSPNPTSRNVPVQNSKIGVPNMSPPSVLSQNAPSTVQHIPYSTIQALSSQSSEQDLSTHSSFMLRSPSVPSSMVNTLEQSVIKGQPSLKPSPNMTMPDLTTSSTMFPSSSSQINSQSYPSLTLQNPSQTLNRQAPATSFMPSNTQSKSVWLQSGSNLEELIRMQKSIRSSSPNLNQTDFTNQRARNFSSSTIGGAELDNKLQSFMTGAQSSTVLFPNVSDATSNLDLKLGEVSTANTANINLNGQNSNTTISSFNRPNESSPKTVSIRSETSVPQNVQYQGVPLIDSDNDDIQITSIVHANKSLPAQPLASPRPSQQSVTSVNNFFVQNSAPSTANKTRNENIFTSEISQPRNVIVSSLTQGKNDQASNPSQNTSVFKLVSNAATLSSVNSPTQLTASALFKNQTNTGTSKPVGITTIRISSPPPDTSPSLNTAGFRFPTAGFKSSAPPPKAVSIQPPRTSAIRLKSPTTSAFPTFKLSQGSLATSGNTQNARPMVFTLAPGAHATLKGLPANLKDKLGRPVIFLQKPSGQPINTPKPQPMKIVFVSDSSIRQVVSGPVKSKVAQTSVTAAVNQTPALAVMSKVASTSNESKLSFCINTAQKESSPLYTSEYIVNK